MMRMAIRPIAVEREAARARWKAEREIGAWARAGRPAPPPHLFKQRLVAAYAGRHHLRYLIETGTFRGDMVAAQRRRFRQIWSIELDPNLYQRAAARFAGIPSIRVVQGDSATLLPQLIATIDEPCLFWLDGHWSGGITARGSVETPIVEELSAILAHPVGGHVVLIDDARHFTGEGDYPSVAAVRAMVAQGRPEWSVGVADDVIRIHG